MSFSSDVLLEVFSDPESAFGKLKDAKSTGPVSVLFLSGWMNLAIAALCLLKIRANLNQFVLLFLISGIFLLVLFSIKAATQHMIAELMGGSGKISGLFASLSFALLPLHLSLPAVLLTQRFSPFLSAAGIFALLFWSNLLSFKAIKTNYGLSNTRTLAVGIAPSLLVLSSIITLAASIFILAD